MIPRGQGLLNTGLVWPWALRWVSFAVPVLGTTGLAVGTMYLGHGWLEDYFRQSMAVIRNETHPAAMLVFAFGPAVLVGLVCVWPLRVIAGLGWPRKISMVSAVQLWVLASGVFVALLKVEPLWRPGQQERIGVFLGLALTAGFAVYVYLQRWVSQSPRVSDVAHKNLLTRWFGFVIAVWVVDLTSFVFASVVWRALEIVGDLEMYFLLSDARLGMAEDLTYLILLAEVPIWVGAAAFLWLFRIIAGLGWAARLPWSGMLLLWLLAMALHVLKSWALFTGLVTPSEARWIFLALAGTFGFGIYVLLQHLSARRRDRRAVAVFD